MSRLKGFIILLIAIGIGYLAAVLVSRYIETQTDRLERKVAKEKMELAKTVVASKEIPIATKIMPEDLKIIDWPKEGIPKDAFSQIEDLKGRITRIKIFEGELIIEGKLVPKGGMPGLPALIPKGERAVAMKVSEVSGIAGFIHPGDLVDVISVITRGTKEWMCKTILQNVKVLGVGTEIEETPGKKPKRVDTVTLLLSPQDVEKLALAAEAGELRLALRSRLDQEVKEIPGVTLTKLTTMKEKKEKPVKRLVKKMVKIEVIKGKEMEIKEFSCQ